MRMPYFDSRGQTLAEEREALRRAIIPIPIDDLLCDKRYRDLKELANKHNLAPFNGTGVGPT